MVTTAATLAYGHSDRPLTTLDQDSLGLKGYAEGLAEFIRRCDTPFTVAVQGDWGTGKTSLMRMVEDSFTSRGDKILPVWFQTWQYSQFGATHMLPASLLSTLLQCLSGDPTRLEHAKQVMGKLLKPAANFALRASTGGAAELQDLEGLVARESVDSALNANELKAEIEKVVNAKLAKGVDRIVVFIDDLDRIKPEIAVEILETIKLFIDWRGCVFVLALDYEVVKRGLKQKFDLDEKELGRSFFDKIIQLPFSVPVGRYTVDKYIDGLFRDMRLPMGEGDGALFERLVRWSVSVNPRGIKRVFNSLHLLVGMAGAREDRLSIRILFALLCLQVSYGEVYDWLIGRAEDLSEADLLALQVPADSERNPDLAAATGRLSETERANFEAFTEAFIDALQDPATLDDRFDEAELTRIRDRLSLSRVTSVQAKTSAEPGASAPANDPEFRWRNRDLMKRLRTELEQDLAADIAETRKSFWTNTAHQSSAVWLKRNLTPDGSLNLVIDHGETAVLMYVEGGKRALRANRETLRQVLEPLGDPYEFGEDEGPLFFRRTLAAATPLAERETLLTGEVKAAYLAAQRALKARLWR